MIGDRELQDLARAVVNAADAAGLMVVTAESCTGGMVAAALTDVPGSSSAVFGGFVTYANEAKTAMLGVPAELIATNGAVSAPVARAMAEGAIANSQAGVAVSITGIAGPGGGSEAKPVGLVHFATAVRGGETVHAVEKFGDLGRHDVRLAAAKRSLKLVLNAIAEVQSGESRLS